MFIITRSKLVGTDQDELFDLYDVSSDGVTLPAIAGVHRHWLSGDAGGSADIRDALECDL